MKIDKVKMREEFLRWKFLSARNIPRMENGLKYTQGGQYSWKLLNTPGKLSKPPGKVLENFTVNCENKFCLYLYVLSGN